MRAGAARGSRERLSAVIAPTLEEEGERRFQKVYKIHKKNPHETEPRRRIALQTQVA